MFKNIEKVKPHMSDNIIEYFDKVLSEKLEANNFKYLEYGSGGSTIKVLEKALNKRVESYIFSVEHDMNWYSIMKKFFLKIFRKNFKNFKIQEKVKKWSFREKIMYIICNFWYVKKDIIKIIKKAADKQLIISAKNIRLNYNLVWLNKRDVHGRDIYINRYVEIPTNYKYDVIFIDGNARALILNRILNSFDDLKNDTIILLHDAHRVQYSPLLSKFKKGRFMQGSGNVDSNWNSKKVDLPEYKRKRELWVYNHGRVS